VLQVRKYSGGMKRRLEVARAVLTKPKILLLDEPTLGLDAQARKELWDYVYNNDPDTLEKMLKAEYSPQYIQHTVLPSSKNIYADYSASLIDVKLAF
jgi:energy-coupling factor transporter ATP-binding protein EcfA2